MALGFAHAQALAGGAVEATLDVAETFRDGVSLVWSPNGQAAWDTLKAYHKVDKIVMRPRSVTAEALDAFQLDKGKVLPPDTLIFAEDDSPEFRERIRTALRKQVGERAAQLIEPYQPLRVRQANPPIVEIKKALIVTSIAARPRFPNHFVPDASPKVFRDRKGGSYLALGFGAQGKLAASQGDNVRVLTDDLKGQHALRFTFYTGDANDRQCLVLSTPGIHQNLDSALKEVRELLAKERVPTRAVEKDGRRWRYEDIFSTDDVLWLPYFQTTTLCEYPDLSRKKYLESPDGLMWWELGAVQQLLSMKLNHEGALVESTFKVPATFLSASSAADGSAGASVPVEQLPPYPKRFVFDRPFIASFWREGAEWPYLACWIDGPEMLTVKK
ncbi:hypothetical protein G5S37_03110 [Roseimicrobium sp. ORNL1]|nr:hypothetical protein G5S37_03110 [Roseimicrobium sp. ORNL1]